VAALTALDDDRWDPAVIIGATRWTSNGCSATPSTTSPITLQMSHGCAMHSADARADWRPPSTTRALPLRVCILHRRTKRHNRLNRPVRQTALVPGTRFSPARRVIGRPEAGTKEMQPRHHFPRQTVRLGSDDNAG
jgi:hypothetical protein